MKIKFAWYFVNSRFFGRGFSYHLCGGNVDSKEKTMSADYLYIHGRILVTCVNFNWSFQGEGLDISGALHSDFNRLVFERRR